MLPLQKAIEGLIESMNKILKPFRKTEKLTAQLSVCIKQILVVSSGVLIGTSYLH